MGRRSVLVTGLPRSGTTWVARLLAESRGTAMLGREPMNPRDGQFALGGRLHGWARLENPDAGSARVLRRVYAGREPRTYGRYGVRQWRCAAPGTSLVVKDPFALLSIQAVSESTGAIPVVVYRSAVANLSSYRRMGWTADADEFRALGAVMDVDADDDATAMAQFWSWGYERALDSVDALAKHGTTAVVVSHADLTAAGTTGQNQLRVRLGLDPVAPTTPAPHTQAPSSSQRVDPGRLHNFDRTPAEVLSGGRAQVDQAEVSRVEGLTAETWSRLEAMKLPVLTAPAS